MGMASTDKIEAFLAEPRNIVVAGIRRDGRTDPFGSASGTSTRPTCVICASTASLS